MGATQQRERRPPLMKDICYLMKDTLSSLNMHSTKKTDFPSSISDLQI